MSSDSGEDSLTLHDDNVYDVYYDVRIMMCIMTLTTGMDPDLIG